MLIPQNRFEEFGLKFCEEEYANVKADLEEVCGHEITNDAILDAIKDLQQEPCSPP